MENWSAHGIPKITASKNDLVNLLIYFRRTGKRIATKQYKATFSDTDCPELTESTIPNPSDYPIPTKQLKMYGLIERELMH